MISPDLEKLGASPAWCKHVGHPRCVFLHFGGKTPYPVGEYPTSSVVLAWRAESPYHPAMRADSLTQSIPPPRPSDIQAPAYGLLEINGKKRRTYLFQKMYIDGRPLLRITVGRHTKCDIHLDNESVSRSHAVVTRTKTGYVIYDMKSTNGVYLNYTRMRKPSLLEVGMRIHIGASLFVATDANGRIPITAFDYTHLGQRAAGLYGSPEMAGPMLNRSAGVIRRQLARLWRRTPKQ